jgi:hypothetical protein
MIVEDRSKFDLVVLWALHVPIIVAHKKYSARRMLSEPVYRADKRIQAAREQRNRFSFERLYKRPPSSAPSAPPLYDVPVSGSECEAPIIPS